MVLVAVGGAQLRFDEALGLGYGYDLDYCLQVRAAGRKVVTADLRATCTATLELIEDLDLWVEAHIRVAEKWDAPARRATARR